MKGRAIDFRTKGDAMYYFGDGRVKTLLDDVQRDMKQGNYYSAAEQFLYYVDHYYDEGIDDDKSNKNIDLQEKEDNKFLYVVKHYGIVIAGGSIIVAVIVVIVVKNRYKHNGKALFDQRGFTGTQKAGENVDLGFVFSHNWVPLFRCL